MYISIKDKDKILSMFRKYCSFLYSILVDKKIKEKKFVASAQNAKMKSITVLLKN